MIRYLTTIPDSPDGLAVFFRFGILNAICEIKEKGGQGKLMSTMNIIYCCPGGEPGCRKVKRVIDLLVTAEQCEVFQDMTVFEKHIRSYLSHEHLIILHAEDKKHVQQFVCLRELLVGHRIIMILPDNQQETLACGHSLRPRFITYADADFLEMASVLCNILRPTDHTAMPPPAANHAASGRKDGN